MGWEGNEAGARMGRRGRKRERKETEGKESRRDNAPQLHYLSSVHSLMVLPLAPPSIFQRTQSVPFSFQDVDQGVMLWYPG